MKNTLLMFLLSLAGLGLAHAQTPSGTASLEFDLGLLSDASGAAIPDGSLIQIYATHNGAPLPLPNATDFLGGSTAATLIFQGGFDSSTSGIPGGASIFLSDVPVYSGGTPGNLLDTGDALYVRWYPSLTTANTAPGATTFGQYGFSTVTGTMQDNTWTAPAAIAATDYPFLTFSFGGALDDAVGRAVNLTVAVPEPTTTAALAGLVALGLAGYRRSRAARRMAVA